MKNKKGFTLIELLSVIFILGILLLIAIPATQRYLNKGTKTYYQNLEKTVLLAGKEYLNDYKVLLPRVIGNVEVIELNELTSNKYIKDVVDHNNKKCEATVTVKKVSSSKYEYYSCLKCENYESKSENCGYSEDDNVAAGTEGYSIKVEDYYEVAQGTEFILPIGEVYYKEEQVATSNPSPKVVDTNTLGEKKITYSYKQLKKIVTVKVVDKTSPSKPTVSLIKDTSRYYYSYDSDCNEGWSDESIYQKFNSTDYTKPGVLGSGIDYYAISTDDVNYIKVSNVSNSIAGIVITSPGVNYLTTTSNGQYKLYVKSVDKAGNWSESTEYNFKIDKENPKITASISESTATFSLSDNMVVAGYGVNQSATEKPTFTPVSGCKKNENITYEVSEVGTYYAWVKDGAGNVHNQSFEVTGTCNVNETWDFAYTGTVAPFEVPSDGLYKLEVWGAQGAHQYNWSLGGGSGTPGLGGYSYGDIILRKGEKLFINVGGKGKQGSVVIGEDSDGDSIYISSADTVGYNGGGRAGGNSGGGGGGATHIATTNRGVLSNYSSYQNEVLIVAGGGGGAGCEAWSYGCYHTTGGSGGGTVGNGASGADTDSFGGSQFSGGKGAYFNDTDEENSDATGGTGSFGQGGNGSKSEHSHNGAGGGGGGWYGGGGGANTSGSGGSGYIGNSRLFNKAMYCYDCKESVFPDTRTISTTNSSATATQNYTKTGNGYAKITLVSCESTSVNNKPTVTVSVSGSTATFNLSDDIGVVAYGVNQSSTTEPSYNYIATTTLITKKYVARSTGTYYVWVKDVSGLTSKAQFTISSLPASNLKDTILTDNNYIESYPNISTTSSNSNESGLYMSTDTDSGNPTYYFRGNVTNNYVSFAGYKWRIVRINEDETIRLVMEGNIGKGKIRGSDSAKTHMYYSLGTTTNHANIVLNNWYTNNIADNSTDSGKVATGNYFCEIYKTGDPTFKCEADKNGYSTVNASIGLLTKEEVRFAGGVSGVDNTSYYLYDGNGNLTMSAGGKIVVNDEDESDYYSVWRFNKNGRLIRYSAKDEAYLRPVINLKSTVTATGSGTSSNPYVIK